MLTFTMSGTTTVPAGDTVENALIDEVYRRVPFNASGMLFINIEGAGVRYEYGVAGRMLTAQNDARIAPATGLILKPDDMALSYITLPVGAEQVLRLTNPTVAPLDVNWEIFGAEAEVGETAQLAAIRGPLTVGDGDAIENVLAGIDMVQFPRVDSDYDIYMSAGDPGLLVTLMVDQRQVAPPRIVPASNRVPIEPDDQVLDSVEVPAKANVAIRVENPTGGAIDFSFAVKPRERTF